MTPQSSSPETSPFSARRTWLPSRIFLLLLLLAGSGVPSAALADNPVFTGADPHAIVVGKEIWIYPTGNPTGQKSPPGFFAMSSPDLVHWKDRGEVIVRDDIPWIDDDGAPKHYLWAPGVATRDGKWYLYYSVGPQKPTPSRIGVAVAARPEGPYQDIGVPLVTGGKGFEAIDPMVFIDPKTKTPYLYAGGSAGARLRIWQLKPDMIAIDREIPTEQPPQFTEGAFMHERGGVYYLSYSHGHWNRADYSVHYATSDTPVGPWTYRGAILESDGTHEGPGHHSFVEEPGSKDWLIVYHRWDNPKGPPPFKGRRVVAIDRLVYNPDGTIRPVVMTDGPDAPVCRPGEDDAAPSGCYGQGRFRQKDRAALQTDRHVRNGYAIERLWPDRPYRQ